MDEVELPATTDANHQRLVLNISGYFWIYVEGSSPFCLLR
jgi:hypothetical protein